MTSDEVPSEVMRIETTLWAAVRSLDPVSSIAGSDAVDLYGTFDRIARAAGAAKVLLAKRVEASGVHRLRGHATAADLLAATSGVSLSSAKGELETSARLDTATKVKAAMLNGLVSPEQGRVIADAAVANAAAEDDLIAKAQRTNYAGLQQEALKAKAAGDRDRAATEDRIRAARRVTRHTDGEGARCLHARGPVVDGSVIENELDALTDEIFRARGKAGTTECRDAYVWDAWVQMARNSRAHRTGETTGRVKAPAAEHLALLRADIEALRRGHVEGDELCEIAGLGPISVPAARELLGTAALRIVITRGTDVLNVTSLTRGPTQAMKYAALWSNPTCCVEGCTRTRVEYDHIWGAEYATTKHTRLDELERVCHHHHDLHTLADWALLPGPPDARPLVPPEDPRHPKHHPPGPPVVRITPDPHRPSPVTKAEESALNARTLARAATLDGAPEPLGGAASWDDTG